MFSEFILSARMVLIIPVLGWYLFLSVSPICEIFNLFLAFVLYFVGTLFLGVHPVCKVGACISAFILVQD